MLKGNDLILSIDGVRLAAAKSCGVDRNVDTLEVCSPVDGPAKSFRPTTTSWGITAGGLYANKEGAERLREIWRAYQNGYRTLLRVNVTTEGVGEEGEAILTSLHEDGNLNELVKFSIQLQGSGKLRASRTLELAPDIADKHMRFDADGHLHVDDDEDDQIDSVDLNIEQDGIIDVAGVQYKIDGAWMILRGTSQQFSQDIYNDRGEEVEPYIVAYGQAGNGRSGVLPAGQYCVFACNFEGKMVATVWE